MELVMPFLGDRSLATVHRQPGLGASRPGASVRGSKWHPHTVSRRREREAEELVGSVPVGAAGVEDGLRRIDDACGGDPEVKKAAVQALHQVRQEASSSGCSEVLDCDLLLLLLLLLLLRL